MFNNAGFPLHTWTVSSLLLPLLPTQRRISGEWSSTPPFELRFIVTRSRKRTWTQGGAQLVGGGWDYQAQKRKIWWAPEPTSISLAEVADSAKRLLRFAIRCWRPWIFFSYLGWHVLSESLGGRGQYIWRDGWFTNILIEGLEGVLQL